MKEKPILFSSAMVRALLDGSKTQTRRVLKTQPPEGCAQLDIGIFNPCIIGKDGCIEPGLGEFGAFTHDGEWSIKCPYGQVGDRLWVKETFFAYGRWETRFSEKKKRDEWHFIDMTVDCDRAYQYAADNPDVPLAKSHDGALPAWYRRPAIFMRRAASRIQLEITGIRVERLQDISETDAEAEGIEGMNQPTGGDDFQDCWRNYTAKADDGWPWFEGDQIKSFRSLWESTGGNWDDNPWVWAISFRKVN